ncbi:hypothetical protein CQW23_12486 [Capsicum baccatum]|uniref:Uncharacterized protein n=1 Tax=Capsicum baccatum TaxID=33114 RepID=A0A2G2WSN5_CAPBA|nr:hypothetical protein CQW23_12486 [Capsicum baccatum]
MLFFLTLRSVQTLSDPKIIDGIKIELFGATAITKKIILKGGLVAIDDGSRSGSGSGVAVGANDAPLIVFKTTSHYDYDHTGCTDFSPNFATCSKCSPCKCQDCKAKHDGVINDINARTAFVKEMASNRALIILAFEVDIIVEATTEEHNITVDNPSTASKEEEKVEFVSSGEQKNYPFEGFNISDEDPIKLIQLINDYSEWIADGLLKHHAGRNYGPFVVAYAEYLSDGLQVPNNGLDAGLLHKIYDALLWKYREAKAQKPYASNVKDPRRAKLNFVTPDEEQLVSID